MQKWRLFPLPIPHNKRWLEISVVNTHLWCHRKSLIIMKITGIVMSCIPVMQEHVVSCHHVNGITWIHPLTLPRWFTWWFRLIPHKKLALLDHHITPNFFLLINSGALVTGHHVTAHPLTLTQTPTHPAPNSRTHCPHSFPITSPSKAAWCMWHKEEELKACLFSFDITSNLYPFAMKVWFGSQEEKESWR